MRVRDLAWPLLLAALSSTSPAAAELPAFLRKENSQVREGNELLTKGDAKAALESYNRAARELPDAAGVQLDRGLALLKQGDFAKARESLLSATAPSAPAALRADAYADLSLAFYREADGLAAQNKHEEAQKMFREALDAGKRSLRLRPGDPNTAWNLELAARRVREEQDKQKQEDDKKKQDEKNKDDKNQDKSQDQKQDPNSDKDQKQDPAKSDSDGDKSQKPDQPKDEPKDKPADKDPQKQADKAKQDQPKPEQPKPEERDDKTNPAQEPQALPPEAKQALDSLEGGEENFERYRARQRAARERRAPEKDW